MTIKVFLADDHTVVREGICALLDAERDMQVAGMAPNGRDAVRQVQQIRPDVVIMDIAMPEMNGIEATLQIGELCPSSKVIILSMHETVEYIFQALKAGAFGYLLKEAAGTEVVDAIRTVYKGHRYLSKKIEHIVIDDYIQQQRPESSISPLEALSLREREVLQLVVEGNSSLKISEKLFLSPKTVETYRSRLMQKLDIKDIPSLVKFALKHGMTTLDS